jgi:hypothetical protein
MSKLFFTSLLFIAAANAAAPQISSNDVSEITVSYSVHFTHYHYNATKERLVRHQRYKGPGGDYNNFKCSAEVLEKLALGILNTRLFVNPAEPAPKSIQGVYVIVLTLKDGSTCTRWVVHENLKDHKDVEVWMDAFGKKDPFAGTEAK